jgi:hypothetical protein
LATIASSFGYNYQNFVHVLSLWSSNDHDVTDTTFELNRFEVQTLQACSILATIINDLLGCCDLDLGGPLLASLALTIAHNPLGRGLHVDRHFFSLFFLL